jgi:hypothetical protein
VGERPAIAFFQQNPDRQVKRKMPFTLEVIE